MKYAITGHTSGIGKAISESVTNFIGFSKSTGYNINEHIDRKHIIKQCNDVDIFINNAHDGFGQTYMLLDLFHAFKDTNKTMEKIHDMDQVRINLLEDKIKRLESDVLKSNNRIFVFRPWKLFKKKKQNVGD